MRFKRILNAIFIANVMLNTISASQSLIKFINDLNNSSAMPDLTSRFELQMNYLDQHCRYETQVEYLIRLYISIFSYKLLLDFATEKYVEYAERCKTLSGAYSILFKEYFVMNPIHKIILMLYGNLYMMKNRE